MICIDVSLVSIHGNKQSFLCVWIRHCFLLTPNFTGIIKLFDNYSWKRQKVHTIPLNLECMHSMYINSSIIVKEVNFSIGMNSSFSLKTDVGGFTESIMKVWYPECLIVILISDNDFGIDVMKWNNSFRLHLVNIIINLKHPFLKIKSSCWRSILANEELSGIGGWISSLLPPLSCHSCPIKDLETYQDHPTNISIGIKTMYGGHAVSFEPLGRKDGWSRPWMTVMGMLQPFLMVFLTYIRHQREF